MSDPSPQQPSPTKRGRGRGRGASSRGAASARAGRKPTAGRRGRQKVYETSRAQAAHERQRDLKNAYATVAAAMRPALEELADRNIDLLKSKFDAHQEVDQYTEITRFLDQRLQGRLSELDAKLKLSTATAQHEWDAKQDYTGQSFYNRWDDLVEDYLDAQLRRLDILEDLQRTRDPLNKLDLSWNYKSITTEEAAEQGIYRKIYKGVEVPYPHLHPELASEASKSKATRTPIKRKGAELLEGQPTPKRPVSSLDNKVGADLPRHIGGLLSAVAPDEPASQPPSPSPVDDNDDNPSPPNEPTTATRGRKRKQVPARSPSAEVEESDAGEDETMPPLPNGAAEPDEHGARLINKRARAGDMPNNRIMLPALFEYEPHEIGFRDSTNDKSRGATKAKRKKFLGQPNSNAMFFDRTLWTYDATQYADGDLDQDLIAKHKLHPKYGLFMENSANDAEPPRPYQSGWKPTVFVPPDGKIIHTSRSISKAKAEGAYVKKTLKSMLSQFMDQEDLTEDDLYDPETERLLHEREDNRIKLEQQEDEAQDEQDQQLGAYNIELLVNASSALESREAQEAQSIQEAQTASPVLSRPSTMSRPYDAVRDIFGNSNLPPAAASTPPAEDVSAMKFLADIAIQEAGEPQNKLALNSNIEEPPQIPIQMPEPVRPKQLRDPQELVQADEAMGSLEYPDPQQGSAPQLAMPEHFMGGDRTYAVQPHQNYHDQQVPQSPLAPPEHFTYRGPESVHERQHAMQAMQPPQSAPGQYGQNPPPAPPEPYGYREADVPYEQPQMARSLPHAADERHVPIPNTDDALLDPQLFEDGQQPKGPQHQKSQQAPQQQLSQHSNTLQQPQTSFFQTALNSPSTPTPQGPPQGQPQAPDYPEPPQMTQQYAGPPLAAAPRPAVPTEGSPGRTPFSNPAGLETQPLPPLRPLHRGSGSGQLMHPTTPGPQAPQHITTNTNDQMANYPPPPPSQAYADQPYQPNGYGPDQPLMSTEQGPRPGYMAQPVMQSGHQQPTSYSVQHSYPPGAPMGSQHSAQYDQGAGQQSQVLQSPPPYHNTHSAVSTSPGRRSGSISSTRNNSNNKQYREIKPAPRQAETWDNNGSELRTLMYNPYEGIRDYSATAPPPSHGPTQIRGWTHTTGSRKSRGKNSTDSQADPSPAREDKNLAMQQEPTWEEVIHPPTHKFKSKKRGPIDDKEDCDPPVKRQKIEGEGECGPTTEKPVQFRPANRAPPTEEDLELTKPLQGASSDAEEGINDGFEKDLEYDQSSPHTKRVSELRGSRPKRSSRTRHMEKVARRSEYGLRSGLRKEWSMS
ncbi:hypothetical protein N8I77_007323 [Diaporthe amygdali]|uniref:Uncharacterized protein n=1 Tax=Phomopsis amygdali TaxID=1214568 RepID=A0AAD9W1G1_PHOAM|nr:hypothetical protein N8I77_007323 [Diaporthe amygdali]